MRPRAGRHRRTHLVVTGSQWSEIVVVVVATIVLATAAFAQAVVGTSSPERLNAEADDPESGKRTLRALLDPHRAFWAAMILLQTIAAIVVAAALTQLMQALSDGRAVLVAILITVAIVLLFGQALPRALASKDLGDASSGALRLASGLAVIMSPLTWLIARLAEMLDRVLPGTASPMLPAGFENELPVRVLRRDDQVIGAEEREMIDGILHLEELSARDIMVSRLDIVAVERGISPQELVDIIIKAGHSRIPVYQSSIDRVLGVLYAKDLLPFVIGTTRRIPLLDLIRPAFVVPESKRISDLFTELKRAKIHIAIVADEYGGTAGLVTIEDILEEIVGEIQDEYDTEEPLFELVAPAVLLADGRLPIEDVEDALNVEFEDDDDFGTLGGFVHKHLGRLPIQGDVFEAEGVRVEILSVERHRVRKLRLTRIEPEETASEGNGRVQTSVTANGKDDQSGGD